MLDGVYRDGAPTSVEVGAPTDDELQALLQKIITKLMKLLSRRGVLEEDMGQTYLAEPDAESDEARMLRSLQAAAVTLQAAPGQWPGPSPGTNSPLDCLRPGSAYRIAFGPRGGQKVLTPRRCDTARGHGAPACVCRHRRFQPACRGAGRSTSPQAAGATVPLHHPASACRRTGAAQRGPGRWS